MTWRGPLRGRSGRATAPILLAAFFPACQAVCQIETDRSFVEEDASSGSADPTSTGSGIVTTSTSTGNGGGDGGYGGASTSATQGSGGAGGDGGHSGGTSGDGGQGGGTSGNGGQGGGTSGDGGQGGHVDCPDVGPATNGPYGQAALYFGMPTLEDSFEPESSSNKYIGYHTGSVSPDGLIFVSASSSFSDLRVRTRVDPFSAWDDGFPDVAVWILEPHLLAGNLGLFGGHGGFQRGAYQTRATAQNNFDGIESPGEVVFDEDAFAPSGTGIDRGFTPTPDGHYVAFASTRSAASPDANDGVDDFSATQLWVAEAVDPLDPSAGYTSLDPMLEAWAGYTAPPTCPPYWLEESPNWISDDGTTIVFHSGRTGRFDLYVTSGDPETGEYDDPVRITGLSTLGKFEESFSMPSLATLAASCGRGFAYFRRFDFSQDCASESEFYRVPVCIGAPCR